MPSTLPSFDTLMIMAQQDPEALEQLRLKEIEATISSAPAQLQPRLRGLQFQIDAQRKIHASPMGSCLKISNMMHESFACLRELLNQFVNDGSNTNLAYKEEVSGAQILEFPGS